MNYSHSDNNGNGGEVNHNRNGNRLHVVESEDDEAMLAFGRRLGYLEGLVEEKDKRIAILERYVNALETVVQAFERTLEGYNRAPEIKPAVEAPTIPRK